MIHAAGQLQILQHTLKQISDDANDIIEKASPSQQNLEEILDTRIYSKIVSCVHHHKKIVQ